MEKKKKKSLKLSKRYSIIKPTNNLSKVSAQRESFESGLYQIFSSPPSHLGYRHDIESLINELGIKNEQFFNFVISCLSKIVRNKNDTKIIASYLYLMPNFMKLLRGYQINKKEQDILKDLLNLSLSMSYEKHQKDTILMRFGNKGSTAYVILDGKVDVLIKSFKNMYITKNDYLFYLATLLKYSEYGLINEAINENFSTFPIEIYDNTNIKHLNINAINESFQKDNLLHNKTLKDLNDSSIKNDNLFSNSKTLNNLEEKTKNHDDRHNSSFNSLFKLNEENEEIKEFKSVFLISINKLMKMFNLRKLDKKNNKLNNCSLNEYINRIDLIPEHYQKFLNKNIINTNNHNNENNNTISNKTETENDKEKKNDIKKEEDKDNDSEEENKIYNLKIFTYSKVATLGKGSLFGEIALRDANSLRTGTLITSSECHFTVLSKRIFDNCLKKGTEKYLKEILSFFINLPIFKGIPESLFYHKYYTNLSKKVMLRGNLIITQGEKPKDIVLIKTGIYGLSTRISLFELTKFINHLINLNLKNRNNNNLYDLETNKYNKLLKKIKNLMIEAKSLMNENIKFKKFYLSEINIRVTNISSPDILGYKEYVDENGLYAFSIETKSPENIIFTLDNKFYSDLLNRNCTVRKNQKELLEKKTNVLMQRLMIIRNSLVNSFFDDMGEKQISSMIMKELETINILKLKQKRFLKFKSTEYKFTKKTLEEEINKSNHKEKRKKIKIVSRNNKNNKNINYFYSFNVGEEKQKSMKKSINSYYKINPSKNRTLSSRKYHYDNKDNINKKVINLYKNSKNYYSTNKKNIESNKQIINKKNLMDTDSKDKTQISSQTLKEYKSKNKYIKKNNTETNFKNIQQIKQIVSNNISSLKSAKLNSANNSCRNSQIKGVMLNSLVWEEIKTKINKKINNNNDFNFTLRKKKCKNIIEQLNSFKKISYEEIKSSFNSGRNSTGRIRHNNKENFRIHFSSKPLLYKTSSDLTLNNNLRIKSDLLKKIKTPKFISSYDLSKINGNETIDNNNFKGFYSPERSKAPKINLKIKKMFCPDQIKLIREINKKINDVNILKYHENKFEKYKLVRNIYYNNNLKNRMKLFFSIDKK